MVAGVYLIVNKKTGQKYAGGSIDIERRIKEHINSSNKNSYIDNAIKKHGFDNFDWQIIEELPADWEIIGEREKYWINFYNTFKNPQHYNLRSGGERNFEVSKETKDKMSENHAKYWEGKNFSFEHRKKMSENHAKYWEGKKRSSQTRKKIGEKNSQKRNNTGYYRVNKDYDIRCRQGFFYRYRYTDMSGKRHSINSVSLEKLEKRVKNKGLPWKILDEEKALKTRNEVSS